MWEKIDIRGKNPIAKQSEMDFCTELRSSYVFGFEGIYLIYIIRIIKSDSIVKIEFFYYKTI